MVRVRTLKKGEFFVLREGKKLPTVQRVFIRGDYIAEKHRFECIECEDFSIHLMPPHQFVYTDYLLQVVSYVGY